MRSKLQSHIVYEEGLTNIWGNGQIFSHICGLRRPLVQYDFATDPVWISLYKKKILFLFFISVGNSSNISENNNTGIET